MNRTELEKALTDNVKLGLAEIVKYEDGEPLFRITEKGIAYVEAMPFENDIAKAEWLLNYDKTHGKTTG